MFARSVLRASTRAASSASKVVGASFATSAKLRADGFNPQREVPVSTYAGGEVQRSTITVTSNADAGNDGIKPLTREVFNSMPGNMQKMTLMDKVVIITGWVQFLP